MVTFTKITPSDIPELTVMAEEIWKEHYYTCVDKALTDYVFELFQSEASVRRQLDEGSRYYYAVLEGTGEKAGYISIYPRENKMYLSKLYLKKEFRGRGISKEIIDFVKTEAKKEDLHEIFLNVNRKNVSSIEAYKHLGFETIREVNESMGDGFVCEDYIMGMKF